MNIYEFLEEHNIAYERHDHPAVYTVAEAEKLVPHTGGAHTKNLFLRDKKGKRHLLLVAFADTPVNLKELSTLLGMSNLSFASPERLLTHLGITPGAVSPLGLINDVDYAVEVAFERGVWESAALSCHPLVNTATLVIPKEGVEHFFAATGHEVNLVAL